MELPGAGLGRMITLNSELNVLLRPLRHLQRLDERLSNLRPNFDEVCLQEERLDSPTMLMLISQNMSTNGGSWSKKPKSC